MTIKAIAVTMVTSFLLMAAPVRADVFTDQSRIVASAPHWVGMETVFRPTRGTQTLQ